MPIVIESIGRLSPIFAQKAEIEWPGTERIMTPALCLRELLVSALRFTDL